MGAWQEEKDELEKEKKESSIMELVNLISSDRPAEDILALMNKDTADMASSTLRKLNQFAEDHPTVAKYTGVSSFTDWVDSKAYEIASESGSAVRELGVGRGPSDNYTGVEDEWYANTAPDLLNMYLRPQENTLPMSTVEPTSWTKGTPDQGWRSIKDYSTMYTPINEKMAEHYEKVYLPENSERLHRLKQRMKRDKSTREHIPKYTSEQIENIRQKNIAQELERTTPFMEMISAVESGIYDPNKHAIKFKSEGDMLKQAPGAKFNTQFDLANFTRSLGYDPEMDEYYISTTDVWDFEPEGYGETYGTTEITTRGEVTPLDDAYIQAALMHGAGKGFGIYDRYPISKEVMEFWAGMNNEQFLDYKLEKGE